MSYSASDFYDDVMAATQQACTQVGIPLRPPGDDGGDLEDDAAAVMHTIRRLAGMVNGELAREVKRLEAHRNTLADRLAALEACRVAAIPATPTYEFEAVRYYGIYERYSNGAGLQCTTGDRDEAFRMLATFGDRDETYACEVRRLAMRTAPGRVIARSGPPIEVAKVTAARAAMQARPSILTPRKTP